MKKLYFLLIPFAIATASCNYTNNDAYQTHKQAGAWLIEKIEHFEWDKVNNNFKLLEAMDDAGYVHLYDNDETGSLVYSNNCYFKIKSGITSWALDEVKSATASSEWHYWFAENNRLTIFNYTPVVQLEYGTVYTIVENGRNSQIWYYYTTNSSGLPQKEAMTVKRVKF